MGMPDAHLSENYITRAAVLIGDGQGVGIVAQSFHRKGKERLVVVVSMLVFQNQFIPPLQNSQDFCRIAETKYYVIMLQLHALRLTGSLHQLPVPPTLL